MFYVHIHIFQQNANFECDVLLKRKKIQKAIEAGFPRQYFHFIPIELQSTLNAAC